MIRFVQSVYRNGRSGIKVNGFCSDDFQVQVELPQVKCIIVVEAFSGRLRSECQGESFYANDAVRISESVDSLKGN